MYPQVQIYLEYHSALSPRRNWDPTHPRPWTKGGGNTLAFGWGSGGVPIRTTGEKACSTLSILCECTFSTPASGRCEQPQSSLGPADWGPWGSLWPASSASWGPGWQVGRHCGPGRAPPSGTDSRRSQCTQHRYVWTICKWFGLRFICFFLNTCLPGSR
jgi:hypothetical protein